MILFLFQLFFTVAFSQRLIGWEGETYIPPKNMTAYNSPLNSLNFNQNKQTNQQQQNFFDKIHQIKADLGYQINQMEQSQQQIQQNNQYKQQQQQDDVGWIETLSWYPRAFLYHNFLSDLEVKHLIKLSSRRLKRSQVGTSNVQVSDVRTSYGMFIQRFQDEIVTRVQQKVANWTHLPIEYQEDMQILRYSEGQEYKEHFDSNGRVATVLLYLTDVEEGGETVFPNSEWIDANEAINKGPFSECAQGHVATKPRKGDALLFHSLQQGSQSVDMHSRHRGCPVIKGIKYTGTIWIHGETYWPEKLSEPPRDLQDSGLCYDSHNLCELWESQGECDNNPNYMRYNCVKSCLKCQPCPKYDYECRRQVREQLGYLTTDDDLRALDIPLD
eukprot:TRINITY_DN20142_c0_g2_i2.p1 TRINITY_DN20142_c0_g2~~TRINITY_DN20142_c0_g2_i2.p1  ORF type:complete len:386 (-),score=35.09 TRINITY_DN20142_c0_g2_i2:402-1559(-)